MASEAVLWLKLYIKLEMCIGLSECDFSNTHHQNYTIGRAGKELNWINTSSLQFIRDFGPYQQFENSDSLDCWYAGDFICLQYTCVCTKMIWNKLIFAYQKSKIRNMVTIREERFINSSFFHHREKWWWGWKLLPLPDLTFKKLFIFRLRNYQIKHVKL